MEVSRNDSLIFSNLFPTSPPPLSDEVPKASRRRGHEIGNKAENIQNTLRENPIELTLNTFSDRKKCSQISLYRFLRYGQFSCAFFVTMQREQYLF